jgi:uncharacterized protein (TIGR00288 family)
MNKELKYAVLIDADNTSFEFFKTVFDLMANEGVVTYRRIYGDLTNDRLKSYKDPILTYSLTPVQWYECTKGKNSTDSVMNVDAMEILYRNNVDGFCIVSSDSDFTYLATRLREYGKNVIGMGRSHTPKAFVAACNEFKYLDINEDTESKIKEPKGKKKTPEKAKPAEVTECIEPSLTPIKDIKEDIRRIIEENSDDEGWLLASMLGGIMVKKHPDFDPKHYGHKKLACLLDSLGFVTKKERNPNNTANPNGLEVFVKIKE